MELAPQDHAFRDFTSQISGILPGKIPYASGAFVSVYHCAIESTEGPREVAVKIFSMAPHAGRAKEKFDKEIRRELEVWLRLQDSTIVPLLGSANLPELSLFPALVSEWMPSGTLYGYLEKQGTISIADKVKLAKGVADGLRYLHSKNVVHGELHPGNVLIDASGNPRLTDFGLATVAGDVESQWSSMAAVSNFDPRWRAPEVHGIGHAGNTVIQPNSMGDIYSFGSVMFFIASGTVPWKGKNSHQIIVELSQRATPARPDNIGHDHWNLINRCWSWDPAGRPDAKEVSECLTKEITTIS
ncbi:kinase-like domain-containing protein [Suillus lakei]|nr:kinase-like domain-containing protein [Suillus lakei]